MTTNTNIAIVEPPLSTPLSTLLSTNLLINFLRKNRIFAEVINSNEEILKYYIIPGIKDNT